MLDHQLDERIALAFAATAASSKRNKLYAALAKKQGNPQKARLFDAVARAEKTQANRLLMTLRGNITSADAYYSDLVKQKREISASVAPRVHKAMEAEGNKYGAEFFERLTRVSKNHFRLLEKFADNPSENDLDLHVCGVCGFIAVDRIPDKCPVCNAVPIKFTTVAT